jgi:hypothetical protein
MTNSYSKTSRTYGVIFFTAIFLSGCSYTRLATEASKPTQHCPLSDLAIMKVNTFIGRVQYMDAPEEEISVCLHVRITNTGHAPFHGTVFIGWSDTPDLSHPTVYNHLGPFQPCTLAPGDFIDLTESWTHPLSQPTTTIKFNILTDERSIPHNDASLYHCGAFPVQEERFDNNEGFTLVYPDSIRNE